MPFTPPPQSFQNSVPLHTLPFLSAHAMHPDWRGATELALVQLTAQIKATGRKNAGNLGFVYISDLHAAHASDILMTIKIRTGIANWVGCTGQGVLCNFAEYWKTPAVCLMTGYFEGNGIQVFSERDALPHNPTRIIHDNYDNNNRSHADGAIHGDRCLVHADPQTPLLSEALRTLSTHMNVGDVFGGLVSSRYLPAQFANTTFAAGLSGAIFASHIDIHTRISHASYPVASTKRGWQILEHEGAWIYTVHNHSQDRKCTALQALLYDLSLLDNPNDVNSFDPAVLKAQLDSGVFVSITPPQLAQTVTLITPSDNIAIMRRLAGIDLARGSIAISGDILPNSTLRFCKLNAQAAKNDLIRICTELREEFEETGLTPRGALVVSCVARGQFLFGTDGAELAIIQHALGYRLDKPLPLIGFAANGEIANAQLHNYCTVINVFT